MGSINYLALHCPLSLISALSTNPGNIKFLWKHLGTPRIDPVAAGWEARSLSTVLCGPGIAFTNILWFTRLVAEQACYPHATTTALRNRSCADYRKPSRSFTSRSFSVVRVIFGKAHFSSLAENFQAPKFLRQGFLQIVQSTGKFKLERSNKTKLKKNPQLAQKIAKRLKTFFQLSWLKFKI